MPLPVKVRADGELSQFQAGDELPSSVLPDIAHSDLISIQGGTYHLDATQYAHLADAQAPRSVLAAPAAGGQLEPRALEMQDIQSGVLPVTQGGLGQNASSASGYAKADGAGAIDFISSVPFGDLSDVPIEFTPEAHAASHGLGAVDELSLSPEQLTSPVPHELGGTGVDATTVGNRQVFATDATGTPGFRPLETLDTPGVIVHDAAGLVAQRRGLQFVGSAVKQLSDDAGNDRVLVMLEDTSVVDAVAAAPLSALRFVRTNAAGKVEYAQPLNLAHVNVLGLVLTAASALDDAVQVATAGRITDGSWAWDASLPLWLSTNGTMTQTPPTSGFSLVVARAVSPTTIVVAIGLPITLA